MVTLEIISKFELKKYVGIAYEGDTALLEKYHVGKFTHEQAVESTMSMIEIVDKNCEMEDEIMNHYKVELDGEAIGYVCTVPKYLYSFGINKKYRSKEILIEWWQRIKEVLGQTFITKLYPNNNRAINFCKKQGMEIVEDLEPDCITLIKI